MSGPKGYYYDVDDDSDDYYDYEAENRRLAAEEERRRLEQQREEERRRQEEERKRQEEERRRLELLRQAWVAAEETRRLYSGMREQINEVRAERPDLRVVLGRVDSPPNTADIETVKAYETALRQAVQQASIGMQQEGERFQFQEAVAGRMSALFRADGTIKSAAELVRDYEQSLAQAASSKVSGAILSALLDRLGPLQAELPPNMRGLIAEVRNANGKTQAEGLLLEFRRQVQFWKKDRALIEERRGKAGEWLNTPPQAMNTEEHGRWRNLQAQLLQVAVARQPWASELENEYKAIHAAVGQRRKQERAIAVFTSAITELGYELHTEKVSTLFSEGGEVYFQRPSWGAYHVCLAVRPEDQRMHFRMVRAEDSATESSAAAARQRDKEMEETWCPEVKRIVEQLGKGGVTMKMMRAVEPGQVPIEVVPPDKIGGKARKRRSAQVSQRQQMRKKG